MDTLWTAKANVYEETLQIYIEAMSQGKNVKTSQLIRRLSKLTAPLTLYGSPEVIEKYFSFQNASLVASDKEKIDAFASLAAAMREDLGSKKIPNERILEFIIKKG